MNSYCSLRIEIHRREIAFQHIRSSIFLILAWLPCSVFVRVTALISADLGVTPPIRLGRSAAKVDIGPGGTGVCGA